MDKLAITSFIAVGSIASADIDVSVDQRSGPMWLPSPTIHGLISLLLHRTVVLYASAASLFAFFTAAVLIDELNQTVTESLF